MYAATSAENDPSIAKSHGELLSQFTGHLSKKDLEYFRHWDRLIDFEADASQSLAAKAWLIASETREQTTGTCISSLVFDKGFEGDALGELPPYVFLSFRRSSTSALQTPLCNLGLEKGCHVIVSADRTLAINAPPGAPLPRMHIVRGFLHSATDTKVAVKASRDDWTRIQNLVNDGPDDRPMLFRLDRHDTATGTGTLRQNLINLFTGRQTVAKDGTCDIWPARLSALRDIVVRLKPPEYDERLVHAMFNPVSSNSMPLPTVPGCDLMDLVVEFAELNPDQQAAAEKVRGHTLIYENVLSSLLCDCFMLFVQGHDDERLQLNPRAAGDRKEFYDYFRRTSTCCPRKTRLDFSLHACGRR